MGLRTIALLGLAAVAAIGVAQGVSGAPSPVPTKLILGTSFIIGGYSTTAKVTFNIRPASPFIFTMTSTEPNKAKVAANPALGANSLIKIVQVRTYTVLTTTYATIKATSNGVTQGASLALLPGGLSNLTTTHITQSPSVGETNVLEGSVKLSAAALVDTVIELTSTDNVSLDTPQSVTILAGTDTSTFPMTVLPELQVQTIVAIKARLGNSIRISTMIINAATQSLKRWTSLDSS